MTGRGDTLRAMAMRAALALLLAGLVTGCASYSSRVVNARIDFHAGRYDLAASELESLAAREDNDQLLYLMDLGVVRFAAGQYKQAIEAFLRADKLVAFVDYTSVSGEAAGLLLNENVQAYRGEDFEKLLIHVYLAMAFTFSEQWESALVECRRVNHELDLMISKGKRPYENNAFAKYLAATLFEARGELNSAFVDYRQLLKWGHEDFPLLPAPLMRVSEKLAATQELETYRRKFPGVSKFRLGSDEAEIVLLVERGKAPVKVPSYQFHLVPMFIKTGYLSDHVVLRGKAGGWSGRSHTLFDIEKIAIHELAQRIARITAKKIAGMVAKEAAAYGVQKATDSKFLGALTSLFLHASDQADLRSWTTLPAALQVARVTLPAGRHDLVLDMVTADGREIKAVKEWPGVVLKPGQRLFLSYRTTD